MANVIEILINAKNNASAEFEKATGSLKGFTTAAGLAGAAGAMAGTAIMNALQGAQTAIVNNTLAMSDNVEMLDRMSNYTGISVQRLDLFRQQLEDDGLSSDQLSQALRYLREQINSGDKTLAKYGITSRDAFTALQQMSTAMANAKDPAERAAIATAALGMRNAELAKSLADSTKNMGTLQAEALRNGTALTEEYLAKMRDLDKTLEQFAKTQKSFNIASAELFAPMIEGAAKLLIKLNEIMRAMERMDKQISKLPGYRVPAAGGMASSHSSDYSDPAGYMAGLGGGGRGGGGGGPMRSYDVWGAGMGGLSIMAKLPEAVQSLSNVITAALSGGAVTNGSSKTTEAIEKPLDGIHQAALRFGANIEGAFRSAFANVLAITSSSTNMVVQMFTALANGILQTISDMLASAVAQGLIDIALSFVTGGGGAGAKVDKVLGTRMTAAGGGGNTFIIQSMDARSALDDLLNPTGSFRKANDRMRDIAIAQAG